MEHLRALAVILTLAATVFLLLQSACCAKATAPPDFKRRRNVWFLIVCIAFLAHNFWLYMILAAVALMVSGSRENNKLALFFLLLFALPPIGADIAGLGIIKKLVTIDYIRLLSLTIFLPAMLSLMKDRDNVRFGTILTDKFIACYLILIFLLNYHASTMTHALRSGVIYSFIDVLLPYYVASRSLKRTEDFRDAFMTFTISSAILGLIACFEFARHWLLYASLDNALGVNAAIGIYLERGDGVLRAQGSTGHAIPLGYVMAVAIGLYLYSNKFIPNLSSKLLISGLLVGGLIASVSRGPWVGSVAIAIIFLITGHSAAKKISQLAIFCLIAIPILLVSPYGEKIVSYLPFVGSIAEDNVTYRERLLEVSIGVVLQNPLFGAYDYMQSEAMQELRQGQGIIDIVNSFVGVALSSGIVGLSLFSAFFITCIYSVHKSISKLRDKTTENHILGQSLLATILGIMIIIFTVSSISVIPVIYWSVAGMCVAYVNMMKNQGKTIET